MTQRIEVKTKTAALREIRKGSSILISAGEFVLELRNLAGIDIYIQANVKVRLTNVVGRIETYDTSTPTINGRSNDPVPLIYLSGMRWSVTISNTRMSIGCQEHDLVRWWSFSDRQISAMDGDALEFWHQHKTMLQAICAASGRVSGLEPK